MVAVPHRAAVRRVVVPLPYSEATPLKLALAPLVKATKQAARNKMTRIMGKPYLGLFSFVSAGCCLSAAYSFHDPSYRRTFGYLATCRR